VGGMPATQAYGPWTHVRYKKLTRDCLNVIGCLHLISASSLVNC